MNSDDLLGFNSYAYCENNSVVNVDHSGHRHILAASTSTETYQERMVAFDSMNPKRKRKARYTNRYQRIYGTNTEDLYHESITFTHINTEFDVLECYEFLLKKDYEAQAFVLDFVDLGKIGYVISSIELYQEYFSSHEDSFGNMLYVEKGFGKITITRVYIGTGYSCCEDQIVLVDKDGNVRYNDVIGISYFTD